MTRISGEINLRPTRIGFLVRPADITSISRIMRWSTCLWGGRANPIIPVGRYPAFWRETHSALHKPDREVAREYMKFFEPDVLVEAEPGLAASIGYGALASDLYEPQLINFEDLYSDDGDYRSKFRFGLSVIDAYKDIYQSQRQFVLRDSRPALIFNETKLIPVVEAVFGAFPREKYAKDFRQAYVDVFQPIVADLDVEHWVQFFRDGVIGPFVPTFHRIEVDPRGPSELSFFVFDHTQPADLIDYWNKRLFETPVYPVPLCWLQELAPTIIEMITRNHRPIPNNPFGTKFHTTVYFGRSIKEDTIVDLTRTHLTDCPESAFHWGGVWHPEVPTGGHGPICERHALKVDSTSFDAELSEGNTIRFDTVAPGFAGRFGGRHYRWANVVRLSNFQTDEFALVYPSNLEDRSTPRLFRGLLERPVVTREGWVLGQRFKGLPEWIELSDGPTAIGEWLERKGIKSELSGAGRIAKQMIESLGNLWGSHLIADKETIRLLNSMATQEVVRGTADDATRRQFEGRTVVVGRWKTLIDKRGKNRLPRLTLDDFTKRGILKLGLGVVCSSCNHGNWFGLDDVSYEVTCERCLKAFPFPQGAISARWKYRVTGPFSVPNFAEGAYCVALTLNLFRHKLSGQPRAQMTYATGLNLTHKNFNREVDFAFWHSDSTTFGQRTEPRFVFGEAKSFADDAVTDHDVETLKLVANTVPGSIVVVSVLKTTFTDAEKKRLTNLIKWGRKRTDGRPRAQVLLLTGVELFADFNVEEGWKRAGPPYPENVDYNVLHDLDAFAQTTQRVHLGLDYDAGVYS